MSDETTIPLAQEEAVVEKRRVETGRVRVSTTVREDIAEVDEEAISEHIEVTRVPVGRWVDAPPPERREGDTVILPVVEEVVVVEKRLRLVEEVHLTRRRESRPVHQEVPLRREEVTIERLPPQSQTAAPTHKE